MGVFDSKEMASLGYDIAREMLNTVIVRERKDRPTPKKRIGI